MPGSPRPPSLLALHSYLASQVAKYGTRHLEATLERHGLLLGHHAILTALDDFGPASQRELAGYLRIDKSHLSVRIDHLEAAGLVTRTPDPQDRRRHRVVLGEAGRVLLDRLHAAARVSQRPLLDPLTDAERLTLETLLRRVLDANDQAGEEGGAPGTSAPASDGKERQK
ncbi:MarR family transcriptional regulator [Sphaerisporangium rufum]|uniref:MarR family transcriptional regulator n=1 Tax=Sphaerisporangium rufum TaxID=1381558 RepID=A0A919RBZ7_9ACTN|nr:MarR family transcriptional regulator [Sphaerisporangium rufum]GII81170.1 MarR family transcriptional regulator [Sphaerisporangium rufum]